MTRWGLFAVTIGCIIMMYSQTYNDTEGHHSHAKLIQQEAGGEATQMTLLLTHAEDQLMSAEAFKILSQEFMDLYKEIKK